jgi:hypothetical protein
MIPRSLAITGGLAPRPEHINALPQPARKYVHDLETNADPAGMVAENALLRDRLLHSKGAFENWNPDATRHCRVALSFGVVPKSTDAALPIARALGRLRPIGRWHSGRPEILRLSLMDSADSKDDRALALAGAERI